MSKIIYLLVRDELDGDLIWWETHEEYIAFEKKEDGEKYIKEHKLEKKDFRLETVELF